MGIKRMLTRTGLAVMALAGGAGLAHVSQDVPVFGWRTYGASSAKAAVLRTASDRRAPGAADTSVPDRATLAPVDLGHALGERFRDGMVITGATPHRLILFTFDDGPDRQHTPRLLHELDRAGVKAVFFVSAYRMRGETVAQREQAAIAIDAVRRGHMVVSHGLDHQQLPLLDNEELAAQIVGAEDVFEDIFGARPWLFRPPGGARSERVDTYLASRGYTTVMWNLGTGDVQVHNAEEVFSTWLKVFDRRAREDGHHGGIILLHDTHAWSVDAFKLIHAELMRRNCVLLKRDEELYDIVSDPSLFFQPRAGTVAGRPAEPSMPSLALLEARQARLRKQTAERCR